MPSLAFERRWWARGAVVAGIDEVGRGALAGPVTCAAVVLPTDRRMYRLRDSKQLEPPLRERLSDRIWSFALAAAVGHASSLEIDELGLSAALRLAARRALDGLNVRPDVCLIDGNWDFVGGRATTNERIVHGDAHSASIAAASIVAKVRRDALMREASPRYPPYGFAGNKGYASPAHRHSLAAHGPCILHRLSWSPMRSAE